jgi:hypothetical protein
MVTQEDESLSGPGVRRAPGLPSSPHACCRAECPTTGAAGRDALPAPWRAPRVPGGGTRRKGKSLPPIEQVQEHFGRVPGVRGAPLLSHGGRRDRLHARVVGLTDPGLPGQWVVPVSELPPLLDLPRRRANLTSGSAEGSRSDSVTSSPHRRVARATATSPGSPVRRSGGRRRWDLTGSGSEGSRPGRGVRQAPVAQRLSPRNPTKPSCRPPPPVQEMPFRL